MRQVEDTIQKIKETLMEMWSLVQGQVGRASDALINNNKEAAHEVRNLEKLVDSYELIIDRECENFFALLNPVAVDMRLIVSILKMNNDLERIGDFANGISKTVLDNHRDVITDQFMEKLQLQAMFDGVLFMLATCKEAFATENSSLVGKVFAKDDMIDAINRDAFILLAEFIQAHPDNTYDCLLLSNAIRRIERIGDRCSNIAEDIVYYLEARVLKHKINEKK